MIINPKVGQRVKCVSLIPEYALPRDLVGQVGTIIEISHNGEPPIDVGFNVAFDNGYAWWRLPPHLESFFMSPEERAHIEDQTQREAHANKYL